MMRHIGIILGLAAIVGCSAAGPATTTPGAGEDDGPEANLLAARRALLLGESDEAIRRYERAHETDPANRNVILSLADLYQDRARGLTRERRRTLAAADYLKSAALVRSLPETESGPSTAEARFAALVFYNEACAYGILGRPGEAIDALAEALSAGFCDLPRQPGQETARELLLTDPDLDSVRQAEPKRFRATVEKYLDRADPVPDPAPGVDGPAAD